jgi:hypothetical protein
VRIDAKNEATEIKQMFGLGPASIETKPEKVLHISFHGPDRALYHMQTKTGKGKGPWIGLDVTR